MAMSLSKRQEISAPMCALYLRRKSAMFCSHDFAPLLLAQAMAIVEKKDHSAKFVTSRSGEYVRATQYQEFIHRHESMRSMSLLEFISRHDRVRAPKRTMTAAVCDELNQRDECQRKFFLFRKSHPLSETHLCRSRHVIVIPDLIDPRIPDRESLHSFEDKERYAMMTLIMVFPFHAERDIRDGENSYWEAFQAFQGPKR